MEYLQTGLKDMPSAYTVPTVNDGVAYETDSPPQYEKSDI